MELKLVRIGLFLVLVGTALCVLYNDEACDPDVDFEEVAKQCASGRGLKCNRKTKKCYCVHTKHVWDPAVPMEEMQPDWITRTGEDPSKKGACKGDVGSFCSTIKNDCKTGLICSMRKSLKQ